MYYEVIFSSAGACSQWSL